MKNKPCPFCGSNNLKPLASGVRYKYWIHCNRCAMEGPTASTDERGAWLLWNQRFEVLNNKPDLSKCPRCGGEADNGHDRCIPPNPYLCRKCDEEYNYDHEYNTRSTEKESKGKIGKEAEKEDQTST